MLLKHTPDGYVNNSGLIQGRFLKGLPNITPPDLRQGFSVPIVSLRTVTSKLILLAGQWPRELFPSFGHSVAAYSLKIASPWTALKDCIFFSDTHQTHR